MESTPIESLREKRASRERSAESIGTTREDFTGAAVPAQFKLPEDLCQSLKLHAIQTGKSMSDLVLECLTTPAIIQKAWVSTRRAG